MLLEWQMLSFKTISTSSVEITVLYNKYLPKKVKIQCIFNVLVFKLHIITLKGLKYQCFLLK